MGLPPIRSGTGSGCSGNAAPASLRVDVDSFAEYIRQNHPNKLPKEVQNVTEYVRCMLRLYDSK